MIPRPQPRPLSRPILTSDSIVNQVLNDSTLSGMYLFEGGGGTSLEDSSGNGSHGTITDGTWLGQSLDFNGTSSTVLVGDVCDLTNVSTSMSVFMSLLIDTSGGIRRPIDKTDGTDTGWRILKTGTDTLRFDIYANSALNITNTTAALTVNKWQTVAGTYDGGSDRDGMNVYLDKVAATAPASQAMANNTANAVNLTIGSAVGGAAAFHAGRINFCAIWIGKELTQTEINHLHDFAMSLV